MDAAKEFLSEEEFQQKIKDSEFAEWAKVHDHHYGTPKSNIEEALSQGHHLLFDIDVQGAMNLKKLYKERVLLIFVLPPSVEELRDRLEKRQGDSATAIETRLQNAYNELAWSSKFDYQITNDNLDSAYLKLKAIIQKECL